ncbi:hypothetical protein ACG2DA_22210, partial [Alienimonas sp. DA493]
WWNDGAILEDAKTFAAARTGGAPPVRLLATLGELERRPTAGPAGSPDRTTADAEDLVELLTGASLPGVEAAFVEFAGERHGSALLPAAGRGVRFALDQEQNVP